MVANARAGSAARLGEAGLRELLGSDTGPLYWSEPDDLERSLDEAFASGASVVGVIGGDGTIRSAAKRSLQTGTPIAPLPGGTLNVLPKLALGHDSLEFAIKELPQWGIRELDVGMIGGEPFFLTAACGFIGTLARLREALRPPRQWRKAAQAFGSCVRGFAPSLRGGIEYRLDADEWRRAHTLVLAVGSAERVIRADLYQDKEHQTLQAWALPASNPLTMMRTAWRAAQNWRDADGLEVGRGAAIGLRLGTSRPLVVLDGEPVRLSRVSEARLLPRALRVVAPRPVIDDDLPDAEDDARV